MRQTIVPDLTKLYNDYMNPELQLTEIAEKHEMSRQTLHKIAKQQGWAQRQPRLSDADKQRVAAAFEANPNARLTEIAAKCDIPLARVKYLVRHMGVKRTAQKRVPRGPVEKSSEAMELTAPQAHNVRPDEMSASPDSPTENTTDGNVVTPE